MGKNTINYRQTASSRAGNRGAQAYSQVNRATSLYGKIQNILKVRGKKGPAI